SRLGWKVPASRTLKNEIAVYLPHDTSRLPAKINLLEDQSLKPGEETIAQIRLESPIFAFLGDRFVLRDASEQHTVAGGIVLDPDGDRHKLRRATQRKLFTAPASAPDDVDLCARSEILVNG